MAGKEIGQNGEKEAIRRHLLASTIFSANTGGLKTSTSRRGSLWQRLLKRAG